MESVNNKGALYTVNLETGETFGPVPMTTIAQWAMEGRVPASATLSAGDGKPPVKVTSVRELAGFYNTASEGDETWATIVPYRNPPALIGYYMSIGSLLPFIGALAGPTAIILGIIGLRRRKAQPHLKGAAHAWIAIALGTVGTLISVGCVGSMILAMLAD